MCVRYVRASLDGRKRGNNLFHGPFDKFIAHFTVILMFICLYTIHCCTRHIQLICIRWWKRTVGWYYCNTIKHTLETYLFFSFLFFSALLHIIIIIVVHVFSKKKHEDKCLLNNKHANNNRISAHTYEL